MKALKFYDAEGTGFELYLDYERQSIMLEIDAEDYGYAPRLLDLDAQDIDDIIISLADLRHEMLAIRNINNN